MSLPREIEILLAEHVFGLEIMHRSWPCGREPECGITEAALEESDANEYWYTGRDAVYKIREPYDEIREKLGFWCKPVPHFTVEEIVEKMMIDGYEYTSEGYRGQSNGRHWFQFKREDGESFRLSGGNIVGTMILAVALAALKAKGIDVHVWEIG